ncbi:hypothetical protein VP01_274g2 [Puccinia sorghi]|uniref:Uncharacterized protein n=1 Tax=Puccinia sorghi TaxID=27349 RepID=A0A0L6V3P9_9BASI|nr:hypothetical protein VP01_274g2 [Puccinia sorghi]
MENNTLNDAYNDALANQLAHSVSLLAGTCRFNPTTTHSTLLESQRNTLINNTLQLTRQIFNSSLESEADHLPRLEALTTSPSRPDKGTSHNLLPRTPLEELYLPPQTDHLAVWHQLSLRQNCLHNWVRETLDLDVQALDVQADHDLHNTKEDNLVPQPGDHANLNPDSLDDPSDSDELCSLDDQDDSSYATEQLFSSSEQDSELDSDSELNESYFTTLNDANDDSSSSESSIQDPDQRDNFKDKEESRSTSMPSLDDLESRSSSSRNTSKRRRSAVDSDFFSLAEFEKEAEDGEAEMRRKLRRLTDLRYDDFFAPIAKKPLGKRQAEPADSSSKPMKRKEKVKPKIGRVKFSEEVKVTEIPAKNRGLRVAEISNMDDDEDDDDDSYDGEDANLPSDDESGSEEEGASDQSDSDESSGTGKTDSDAQDSQDEEAGGKTMSRLNGDLFDDGFSDRSASDDPDQATDAQELSRHARKMKALSKQIAQLESENVAKKEWMMKGEAASKDRPQNSLLEEDLEFEHIQKIAPAVTEEKTINLESLIKQRILEGNYDDVIRKRMIDPKAFLPSRLLELQDTQATKSLTEIYEDEYNKTKSHSETGQRVADPKDNKLGKEHSELKRMFESLSGKLDALSNAHFTPHQPTATIKTINNLPSISLESSLPTATGAGTLLAPEELFSVRSTRELVTDTADLTHAQKQNLRTHLKKQRAKSSGHVPSSTNAGAGPGSASAKNHQKATAASARDEDPQARSSVKEQKLASLNMLQKASNQLAQNITILDGPPRPQKHNKRASSSDLNPSHSINKNRKLDNGASFKL